MKFVNWLFIPLGLLFALISGAVLGLNSFGFGVEARVLFTVIALFSLFPFCVSSSPLQVSPSRLFALSILMFILSRPLIDLFYHVDLVEVGNGVNESNLTNALALLSLSISIASVAYMGCAAFYGRRQIVPSGMALSLRIPIKGLDKIAFVLFVVLGILFLLKSVTAASALSAVDYFTAASDPSFHAHLYLGDVL